MDRMPLGDYGIFPWWSGRPRSWGPEGGRWRAWFGGKVVDGLCDVLDEHLSADRSLGTSGTPAAIGMCPLADKRGRRRPPAGPIRVLRGSRQGRRRCSASRAARRVGPRIPERPSTVEVGSTRRRRKSGRARSLLTDADLRARPRPGPRMARQGVARQETREAVAACEAACPRRAGLGDLYP